jgi:hypothetical protein
LQGDEGRQQQKAAEEGAEGVCLDGERDAEQEEEDERDGGDAEVAKHCAPTECECSTVARG